MVYPSPPPPTPSYFPSRKQDFHPEVFLSAGLPLEIMATFLYLTRVLFSPFIPDAGIDLLLRVTIPCFFFYLIRLTELFPFPVHCTVTEFFFHKRLSRIYAFPLPFFFPLTHKKSFQLLNFTFSCTLIAFINGLFFARRVKNYDSSAARNLQDPSTVVSFFMSFPE